MCLRYYCLFWENPIIFWLPLGFVWRKCQLLSEWFYWSGQVRLTEPLKRHKRFSFNFITTIYSYCAKSSLCLAPQNIHITFYPLCPIPSHLVLSWSSLPWRCVFLSVRGSCVLSVPFFPACPCPMEVRLEVNHQHLRLPLLILHPLLSCSSESGFRCGPPHSGFHGSCGWSPTTWSSDTAGPWRWVSGRPSRRCSGSAWCRSAWPWYHRSWCWTGGWGAPGPCRRAGWWPGRL